MTEKATRGDRGDRRDRGHWEAADLAEGAEGPGTGSFPFLRRPPSRHALILSLTALLELAAGTGMAYVAGFHLVRLVLGRVDWTWIVGLVGAFLAAFVGYYQAYKGLYTIEDGPGLEAAEMRAVVAAGFGGFLAQSGAEVDHFAFRAAGSDERDSKVRVWALAGMEHGLLGILGCAAGIAVLAGGYSAPPTDVSLPWAVIPIPGFMVAFFLGNRYRMRFRHARGWRAHLGVFLDCIYLVRQMFHQVGTYWYSIVGMGLFWVADGFSAWCGLAAFGYQMNGARFAVGYATGAVFTRRTGPLAGAGVLTLALPAALYYSGAPLAVAVVGIFVFRVLSVWLTVPFSLLSLRVLRSMKDETAHDEQPETGSVDGRTAAS